MCVVTVAKILETNEIENSFLALVKDYDSQSSGIFNNFYIY